MTNILKSDHSRRSLLHSLALAAAGSALALPAFGQGKCRDGYGQGRCTMTRDAATAPIAPLFAPTGWKTVALDHITFDVADYKKEAAFYIALMGWTLRSDNGAQAVLDIGNWGSAIFRQAPLDSFPAAANGREPVHALVKGFAFVIAPWNAKAVEAALRQRGLNPVAENDGKGFESFHVKDPDGWDVQICNDKGLVRARRKPATAKLSEPLPFAPTGWHSVWLDHLSFNVTNYKESVSFYSNLLGWEGTYDEGSQNQVRIGDVGDAIIRGGNPADPSFNTSAPRSARIDHISIGITPWDVDGVRAALESRGLKVTVDTSSVHAGPDGKMVSDDIHQAAFQSYHTTTPNGYNLQISWVTQNTRSALPTAIKPRG